MAYPLLAAIRSDPGRLKRGYVELVRGQILVLSLVLITLTVLGKVLTPVILGDKWVEAGTLVPVLAFFAFARGLGTVNSGVVLARGKARETLLWNIFQGVLSFVVVLLLARSGDLLIVALGITFLQWVFLVGYMAILVAPEVRPIRRHDFYPVVIPAVMSLGMSVLFSINGVLGVVDFSLPVLFGLWAACLGLQAVVIIMTNGSWVKSRLREMIRQVFNRRYPHPAPLE
jgi:O-antigen/teichoic acid export membrane protein